MAEPPLPDPMPDPPFDSQGMVLRLWIRRVVGVVLMGALLVVVIRGIYVAWQVQNAGP